MSEDVFYKVSFVVVEGSEHPGAIINVDDRPVEGEEITFDGHVFEIIEVKELMPTVGNFGFLHASCKYLRESEA